MSQTQLESVVVVGTTSTARMSSEVIKRCDNYLDIYLYIAMVFVSLFYCLQSESDVDYVAVFENIAIIAILRLFRLFLPPSCISKYIRCPISTFFIL